MYNSSLKTFISVADCGSFTKAAQYLFISPTAIMKQINTLEKDLQLKLIDRTPSGISLTEAGKIIYSDAKYIINYSNNSIMNAKNAELLYETTFCIGTSMLNPAKPFMDLWYKVNNEFADYKLHLVPFEDNHFDIISEIQNIGKKFDFLIGVNNSKTWQSMCNFLPLGNYNKMVAVSREHPLALKKIINIEDLYGQTLMMVPLGDSDINDDLRKDIIHNHKAIKIEDTSKFYDLSVFNRCAETKNILLTIECWQDIHPGLVTIPVNWSYTIPYGLLYTKNAPSDVEHFINSVKKIL